MKDPTAKASLHVEHVKWALQFADGKDFGWESPEQVDYRFYDLRRDAIHQGNDYDVCLVEMDALRPAEFIEKISPRREFYRGEFRKIFSSLAKDNGCFKIPLATQAEASLELRGVTDLHPYRLIFKTGIDPVIEALLIHIAYSRIEGCRIRVCANCTHMFVREGRRPQLEDEVFCGITCARSAATKRYRAAQKEKTDAASAGAAAVQTAERPAAGAARHQAPVKKKRRKK